MRASRFLFIAAAASLGASLAASACGGSTETPADSGTTADAVADVSSPKVDASSDAKKEAAVCTAPTIDSLELPDASLDDGGINTGTCVTCLKKNCQDQIKDCNGICDCRTAGVTFVKCLSGATDLNKVIACATSAGLGLDQDAQDALYAVALCGQSDCNAECIPKGLLDGGDAAKTD